MSVIVTVSVTSSVIVFWSAIIDAFMSALLTQKIRRASYMLVISREIGIYATIRYTY